MIKENPDYGEIICRCEEISKGEIIDALSIIVHRDFAYHRGQAITIKSKELLAEVKKILE